MPSPAPKSLAEHRDFMRQMTALNAWFCWSWLREHPAEDVAGVFGRRSLLPELFDLRTGLGDGNPPPADPAWRELLGQVTARWERHGRDAAATDFEAAVLTDLSPLIERLAPARYEQLRQPRNWSAGSLRYDPPKLPEHPNWCVFHIYNAVAPNSIFTDSEYLPACFRTLMDQSEREFHYDTLYTFTWLNAYDRWLAIFPQEWRDNLGEPNREVWGNLGFWGQFINGRGCLNERAAAQFRSTGQLPCQPRMSHCSYAAMRARLRTSPSCRPGIPE